MFRKRFSLVQREKEVRISYDFSAEKNKHWCEKILKNCQSCFTTDSQKKNLNKNVLNALLSLKIKLLAKIIITCYVELIRDEVRNEN